MNVVDVTAQPDCGLRAYCNLSVSIMMHDDRGIGSVRLEMLFASKQTEDITSVLHIINSSSC
jgi:hypothetical protein